MDVERRQRLERAARRAALGAIPAIVLCAWYFRRPSDRAVPSSARNTAVLASPTQAAAPSSASSPAAARASATFTPPAAAAPSIPPARGARALEAERGEAALKFEDPLPVQDPLPPPAPLRHQVAADLPEHTATAAAPKTPEPPSACGGLVVRLITAAEDQAWAFASVSQGFDQPARIRRVGERVGNWRIASIEWDRVWVQAGASRCAVGMHLGAREPRAQVTQEPNLGVVEVTEPAPVWALPPEIASAIFERSVTEFDIERAAVDALFARGADVFAGVRFTPVYELERLVALELDDVRLDSLLERLNLKSKDRVVSIAGRSITTPEDALLALEASRDQGELVATLERSGERFELHLRTVTR